MTDQDPDHVPQYAPGPRDPSRDELAQDCLDLTLEHLDDEIMSEADCIVANALSVATNHPLFAPRPDETVEAWGRRVRAYAPEADEAPQPAQHDEAASDLAVRQFKAQQFMAVLECAQAMTIELGLEPVIDGDLADVWEYSSDELIARGWLPDDYGAS